MSEFIPLLRDALNSTFGSVSALRGQSSAGLMKFRPNSIGMSFIGLNIDEKHKCEMVGAESEKLWQNPLG